MRPVTVRTRRPPGRGFSRHRHRPAVRLLPSGPWTPWSALRYRTFLKFAAREGHARVPSRHREEGLALGAWVRYVRDRYKQGRLTREQISTLERVRGWRWRVMPARRPLRLMLGLLRRYARREGHVRVPQQHKEGRVQLGRWVAKQRSAYARGEIARERRQALEALPGWTWRINRSPHGWGFEQAYPVLLRFATREGHARVPSKHREAGFPLGRWVEAQRTAFQGGVLPARNARRLERLRGWSWRPYRDSFRRMLAHLHRFVEREGHARVPHGHREGGAALGAWVLKRRQAFQRGALSRADIAALEALPGWTWRAARAYPLQKVFAALGRFVRREGHARVPLAHRESGVLLGSWVSSRRRQFALGRLSPTLVRRLERLPGWSWSPNDDRFPRMFALLRRYVKREGHARVPPSHVEAGAALGAWVSRQRTKLHAGRLSKEEAAALEALPAWVWWASRSQPAPKTRRRPRSKGGSAGRSRHRRPAQA